MQEQLVTEVCKQLRGCMSMISSVATNNDYRYLLQVELRHFDFLLDLLESKINLKNYLSEYHSLFSNIEFYNDPRTYSSLPIIEQISKELGLVSLDEKLGCFVDILRICSTNVKKHSVNGHYDKIDNEIYYCHNVPALIRTENIGAIDYFLRVECVECRARCSGEMVVSYEKDWDLVYQQYFTDN